MVKSGPGPVAVSVDTAEGLGCDRSSVPGVVCQPVPTQPLLRHVIGRLYTGLANYTSIRIRSSRGHISCPTLTKHDFFCRNVQCTGLLLLFISALYKHLLTFAFSGID